MWAREKLNVDGVRPGPKGSGRWVEGYWAGGRDGGRDAGNAPGVPGVRLMRNLVRAAKTQQSTLVKLLDSYAPPPQMRARKAAPRKAPSAVRGVILKRRHTQE
jgi:hypothetical protein